MPDFLPPHLALQVRGVTKTYSVVRRWNNIGETGGDSGGDVDDDDDDDDDLEDLDDDPAGREPSSSVAAPALRGVDLEIQRGEAVGIVGGEGAGKTTLIRILAQTLKPTTGWALIRGPVAPPAVALTSLLEPELEVASSIELLCTVLGVDPAVGRAQAGRILAVAGLPGTGRRRISTLAGIERITIVSSTIVHLPLALYLSDPAAKISDPETSAKLDAALDDRLADGASAVFTARDPVRLPTRCTHIVELVDGRVVPDDSTVRETPIRPGQNVREPLRRSKWAMRSSLLEITMVDVECSGPEIRVRVSIVVHSDISEVAARIVLSRPGAEARRFFQRLGGLTQGQAPDVTLTLPGSSIGTGAYRVQVTILAIEADEQHTVLWSAPLEVDIPPGLDRGSDAAQWSMQ